MAKKQGIDIDSLSPFQQEVIRAAMQGQVKQFAEQGPKKKVSVAFADPFFVGAKGASPLTKDEVKAHETAVGNENSLVKSVLNVLNGPGDSIERLAFEVSPYTQNTYGGLWKRKLRLLPDEILKRIAIQDDLVAAVVNTRSNQIAAFGRPQPDRFSTGFKIEPEPGYTEHMNSQQKKELQDKIADVEAKLLTCGETTGWHDQDTLSLGHFLHMSARNAVVFGRIATEFIYVDTPKGRKFHSFRPIDAGTIYRAAPYKNAAESVRRSALKMLEDIKNKKLKPERFIADEYTWVQVIDGRPVQAFTSEEVVVHNFYPTTDIELDGYPVTPLDTVITAVTTHINIGVHNKLYFQSGRAARGMIVIKSDDIDESITGFIRQQFNASINSVGNAWRMPIFGVGTDDEVGWFPIDNSSRDMEFQYLSDTNSRVILSAFQMSPEELPGYAHLSRGTNNQALSESNNEYKLEAHRDVGIRPLIAQFQNFVNACIMPLIAPELFEFCHFKFVGLDVDTAEKESTRIQQDMAIHMTTDEVLEKVEKKPIGKQWGGQFLLNPQWQAVLDKYIMVGTILEHFFGIEGASQDPRFQYVNNPLWFNWQQIMMQQQQAQQQQQQAEQQQQAQTQQAQQQDQEEQPDLSRGVDQLQGQLSKSEAQLPASRKKLLAHQRRIVENLLSDFEDEASKATDDILKAIHGHLPEE